MRTLHDVTTATATHAARAVATASAALLVALSLLAFPPQALAAEPQLQGSIDIEITAPPIEGAVAIGGEVVREFAVVSLQDPCWVRMRPEIALASTSYVLGSAHADPAEPGWVAAPDGWYYWTSPLSAGQVARFSTSFVLEHDTDVVSAASSGESMRLRETGYAEAIQAEDTYPDFGAPSPWEGAYKGPGEPDGDKADTTERAGSLQKTGDLLAGVMAGCIAVGALCLAAIVALMAQAYVAARKCGPAPEARGRRRGKGHR